MNLQIINYSEKAIAVFGETKIIKEELKAIGGRFNPFLTNEGKKEAGWIFSKLKTNEVAELVSKYTEQNTIETKIEEPKKEQSNEIYFKNEKCCFEFNISKKEITGHDLTDGWNQPKCYNKKTQSFKKALASFGKNFNSEWGMYAAMNHLDQFNMGMRSYCAMD